jgi:hypothetical protein
LFYSSNRHYFRVVITLMLFIDLVSCWSDRVFDEVAACVQTLLHRILCTKFVGEKTQQTQ